MAVRGSDRQFAIGAALIRFEFAIQTQTGLNRRAPVGVAIGPGRQNQKRIRADNWRLVPREISQPFSSALSEHRGQFVRIDSGSNAGLQRPAGHIKFGAAINLTLIKLHMHIGNGQVRGLPGTASDDKISL